MNDITINDVLSQMKALRAQAQDVFPVQPQFNEALQKPDFGELLKQQVDKVNEVMKSSSDLSDRLVKGDTSISEVEVMVSLQKASVAYHALNQVRNKLLTAYQEVMSMTV